MSAQLLQNTPQKPWRPKFKNLIPEVLGALFTALSTFIVTGKQIGRAHV